MDLFDPGLEVMGILKDALGSLLGLNPLEGIKFGALFNAISAYTEGTAAAQQAKDCAQAYHELVANYTYNHHVLQTIIDDAVAIGNQ